MNSITRSTMLSKRVVSSVCRTGSNHRTRTGLLLGLGLVAFSLASASALAAAPPLGDAQSFAILGGSSVNANGSGSLINGNVGVAPGTSVTGFPASATVIPPFSQLGNSQPAIDARASTLTLYNSSDLAPAGAADTGGDDLTVTGTYTPGKYTNGAGGVALIPSGQSITLDGAGIYIFTVANALTVGGEIKLINGADACSVFWRVPTLATINNGNLFPGTIIAGDGVHIGTGVTLTGRALAQAAGDVTLAGGDSVGGCSSVLLGLQKTVDNAGGGTALATDFILTATGDPSTGPTVISGTTPVLAASAPPGVYTLTETGPPDYTAGGYNCDGGLVVGNQLTIGTADAGQTITCTINNVYNPGGAAQLSLQKTVDNTGGGTAVATDFILTATGDPSTGPTVITGTTPIAPTNVPVGAYTLTETGPTTGYTAGYSCSGGGALNGNVLTITGADAGKTISCTITNTFNSSPVSVPTLYRYGMAMLILLLLGAGVVRFRRLS